MNRERKEAMNINSFWRVRQLPGNPTNVYVSALGRPEIIHVRAVAHIDTQGKSLTLNTSWTSGLESLEKPLEL